MADLDPFNLDPRIKRTRALLEQALVKLLETKSFDEISVQDVTEAATLNRGTFYAHYADKYALLACVTAGRFENLLAGRDVVFDDTCNSALSKMFLAVCDFLVQTTSECPSEKRAIDPHMELAIVSVVSNMTLEGLKEHAPPGPVTHDVLAAIIGSALYGAAKQWLLTPERGSAEDMASGVAQLITPMIHN